MPALHRVYEKEANPTKRTALSLRCIAQRPAGSRPRQLARKHMHTRLVPALSSHYGHKCQMCYRDGVLHPPSTPSEPPPLCAHSLCAACSQQRPRCALGCAHFVAQDGLFCSLVQRHAIHQHRAEAVHLEQLEAVGLRGWRWCVWGKCSACREGRGGGGQAAGGGAGVHWHVGNARGMLQAVAGK
jgi:hypothetical protein